MAAVDSSLPVTTPGLAVIVAVALATYLANWAGGTGALVSGALSLNLFFVTGRFELGLGDIRSDALGYGLCLACGIGAMSFIQRIQHESLIDRSAAVAARAAATALAAVEAASASHAGGGAAARETLHRALLRAVVSNNRAHFGMLFLFDGLGKEMRCAAAYGLDSIAGEIRTVDDVGAAFVTEIVEQRRIRAVEDLTRDPRTAGSALETVNARALIGAPLFDGSDRPRGAVIVGLLVPHRFTATETARIEALAYRASSALRTAVEIDERETALHSATEAKHWLEMVIAAMPEAVVLAVPPDGTVIAENQAAVERLGHLTSVETEGDIKRRLTLPEGEPLDHEHCPIQQALRTGAVVTGVELVAHAPSGAAVPVLVSAAPVRDEDGTMVGVVAVVRDIASLKEASRLKDEFISVVSHELRSPLTPIRGFVQLVARDLSREGGHDPQVGRLNSIAVYVDRMTRLVDDLLDVSSLKSGSLEIRPSYTNLGELCNDVVRDRSSTVTSHQFIYERPPADVIGSWDGDRLYQVVDNLIGNAIKYTPPGCMITVAVDADARDGAATITVSDNGPGIAAEDRQRIFSAFYRSAGAEASQITGLGLGLYICHELVAAHGGCIEVGEAPGGGAAFTVRLPRITQAVAA
jgi:PAS domain S-box-containing protein